MALGYTEPDPREDLSGMDVARKALILGHLLGFKGKLESVVVESLVPEEYRDLTASEFVGRLEELDSLWRERVDDARSRDSVLRYRATAGSDGVRVGLVAVSAASSLGALMGTDNQFSITTSRYRDNPIVITGPGAGVAVTAAGVLNDVLKLAGSR
jgi:homoserine dehydrogenase